MKSGAQRAVAGPLAASAVGGGVWRLSGAPDGPVVFLRGADADAAALLRAGGILGLRLDWDADAVRVAFVCADGVRNATVPSALLHEPRPRLYEALPLAGFDAAARRFWQRVFLLMRLPGGRLLVRFIARRRRRPRAGAA